jgi:hypothetical protein
MKILIGILLLIPGLGWGGEENEAFANRPTFPSEAELEAGFRNPPDAVRPGVFWFWNGGLLSREGITRDLEALAAQGIGRVMVMQMPDQSPYPNQWSYRDYPGKVKVLSDDWFEIVNFAIGECDRLGIEFASFACPGWGHLGGPAVPPDKGIKVIASTQTRAKGPGLSEKKLPRPPIQKGRNGGNTIPEWNSAHALRPQPRDNYFEDIRVLAVPNRGKKAVVPLKQIRDVSEYMDEAGNLSWEVPGGDWTIHRLCLVSENGLNHPAPPEAMGLEADRMDPVAVRIAFEAIIGRILREARAKGYTAFTAFETDSYETAYQNFSPDFIAEFKKRRGYDCALWLPAYHGNIVIESRALTERFRHDMSRTISELWAERFHGELGRISKEHGITWMTEPYFAAPLDWTMLGGRSPMPGAEFWINKDGLLGNAPEIAAVYDRRVVWAESFTAESYDSAWRLDPWALKRFSHRAYALGINLIYFHGFSHNPFSDAYQPGLTMGYWGTQLSRHATWWPYAKPWHRYMARAQFLLQQGRPVFHGLRYPASYERAPSMSWHSHGTYRTAQLTDEVLFRDLSVNESGQLKLPSGAVFDALQLTKGALRPDALGKIKTLAEAGAVIIGSPPPRHSPSLEDYPDCDARVSELIDTIWGPATTRKPAVRKLGKGRVLSGMTFEQAMQAIERPPDVLWDGSHEKDLRWNRRDLGEMQVYFLANFGYETMQGRVSVAGTGLAPEWWNPVDGFMRGLPDFDSEAGRTRIPVKLGPLESGFLVFRKPAESKPGPRRPNFPEWRPIHTFTGDWQVSFEPRWGGPSGPVRFPVLSDWSEHSDAGIRHYSGRAVYKKSFDWEESEDPPARRAIDLGVLHDIAQVTLNGEDLGIAWCHPWRVPIPDGLLKPTGNQLEITVANTWVNRLIGDEHEPDDFETIPGNPNGKRLGSYDRTVKSRGLKDLPDWLLSGEPRPSSKRYTFSSWLFYDKDAPLRSAGLLGPVRIMQK